MYNFWNVFRNHINTNIRSHLPAMNNFVQRKIVSDRKQSVWRIYTPRYNLFKTTGWSHFHTLSCTEDIQPFESRPVSYFSCRLGPEHCLLYPQWCCFSWACGESSCCSFFDSSSKSVLTSPQPPQEMHHCVSTESGDMTEALKKKKTQKPNHKIMRPLSRKKTQRVLRNPAFTVDCKKNGFIMPLLFF